MSEELISAHDIRGTKDTGLTVECAWNVGKALAEWLPVAGNIAVAYATSQTEIARAIIEGLRLQGRSVIDTGNGDRDTATAYIKTANLAGAVVVTFDESTGQTIIELYREDARLITNEGGLKEIHQLIEAGNFVPAAVKGDLTHFA